MANQIDTVLTQRVVDWIEEQARKLKISITVYPNGFAFEDNWLKVPVAVNEDGDAYDRVTWLQRIEDEWDPTAFDGVRLFVMPAPRKPPSKTELYAQAADLVEHQHMLIDQIDSNGVDPATIQRFESARRAYEEKLQEIGRRYPVLKNGAV
jgi:hypothetical protein